MIIKRHDLLPVNTNNLNEFMDLNCFYCKGYNAKISPESCYTRRHELKKNRNLKYTKCSQCDNDIETDFFSVVKKRILYRRQDLSEDYIEKYKPEIMIMFDNYLLATVKEKDKISTSINNTRKNKNDNKKDLIKTMPEKMKEKYDITKSPKTEEDNKINEPNNDNNQEQKDTINTKEVSNNKLKDIIQDVTIKNNDNDDKEDNNEVNEKVVKKKSSKSKKPVKSDEVKISIDKKHYDMLVLIAEIEYRTPELQLMKLIKDKYDEIFK